MAGQFGSISEVATPDRPERSRTTVSRRAGMVARPRPWPGTLGRSNGRPGTKAPLAGSPPSGIRP